MPYTKRLVALISITGQLALGIGLVWLASCTTAAALSREGKLSDLRLTTWTAKQGAPAGSIHAIAQTSDGYLWVSDGGLSRFDGLRFTPIDLPRDKRLTSMRISRLTASSTGGLWIGFVYSGAGFLKDGQFKVYTSADDGLPSGSVSGFAETHDGVVWAATTHGIAKLIGARWQPIGNDFGYSLTKTSIRSLMVDSQGTLWILTPGKAFFLLKGEERFQELKIALVDYVELAESHTGALWLEDALGLRKIRQYQNVSGRTASSSRGPLFDRDGALWTTRFSAGVYRIAYPERYLVNQLIQEKDVVDTQTPNLGSTFVEDREGNVWAGMAHGLDRFSARNVEQVAIPIPVKTEAFAAPSATMVASDNGALWVINSEFALLHFKDGKTIRHSEVSNLNCGIRAEDGSTWFAGYGNLWQYALGKFSRTALPTDRDRSIVQAIAQDKSGAMFVSIQGQGIHRLTNKKWAAYPIKVTQPTVHALVMTTDANGLVWAGFRDNQIAMIDGESARVFTDLNGVQVGNVAAIFARHTQIWAGGEFGLARFDKTEFKSIVPATAHAFDGITGIVETENGDIWLNNSAGIVLVQAAEIKLSVNDPNYRVRVEIFSTLDGLSGSALRHRPLPTAIEGTDGRLWFSTSAGIFTIDPARLFRNPLPPTVLIESLNADGKSYTSANNPTLPKMSKAIRIDYVALSLTMAEKVRYRYQLIGVDKGWQDAEARRQAFYTNLSPGTYQFHVIAANNDGVWNETGATLDFVIPPAFVQTGWFVALCIIGGMVMVGLLVRFRVKQISARMRGRLEARLAERERIARELHDTLLQSTQGLILRFQAVANVIPSGDPSRAMLEKALERADEVMAEGRDRVMDLRIPAHMWGNLEQAFAVAGKDLAIESATAFRITADGAAHALTANVREEIYAIGREALLNAFRHADAALIEIEIVYAKQEFRLYVRDNGAGIEETVLETGGRSGHWGLKGMRERAVAIGAQLNVLRRSEGGTEIEVSLPGNIAYQKRTMSSSMRSIRKFFGSAK